MSPNPESTSAPRRQSCCASGSPDPDHSRVSRSVLTSVLRARLHVRCLAASVVDGQFKWGVILIYPPQNDTAPP